MFNLESFVADCRAAVESDPTHVGVAEIMDRAMADPDGILRELGEPTEMTNQVLYSSDKLTIMNVVWAPGMTVMPHNHDMWAIIGMYGGREDNIFWRRIKDHPQGKIEAAGARTIGTGEYTPLGRDIIHSVLNPLGKLSGGIHIYGGDFYAAHQSEWDSEHLHEHERDMSKVHAAFQAN